MSFTIGSLFDGSGGFPMAAMQWGGIPVWAAEVEPYPIAATRTQIPGMKHLGSVTDINGAEIEPVDVVSFGSPCQDLSVAGKRAGLKHEDNGDEETTRSGLFIEAIRIIKEMRAATNGVYPRFIIFENVPGAFSSSGGEDFRTVLQEIVKIVEPEAPEIPSPGKRGWPYADCIVGDGWSIAYRVFDAQYWGRTILDRDSGSVLKMGTPQRRRRVYLVADFASERAEEILFEPYRLRGHSEESREAWESASGDPEESLGADDSEGAVGLDIYNLAVTGDRAASLTTATGQGASNTGPSVCVPVVYGISPYASNAMKSSNPHSGIYEADTSRTLDLNGGNPACNQGGIAIVEPIAVATQQGGAEISMNGVCPTVTAAAGMSGNNQPWIAMSEPVVFNGENITHPLNKTNPQPGDPCHTLGTDNRNYLVQTVALEGNGSRPSHSGDGYREADIMYTLNATEVHGVAYAFEPGIAKRDGNGNRFVENASPTIRAKMGDNQTAVAYAIGNGQANQSFMTEQAGALNCMHDQQAVVVFDKEVYQSGEKCSGGHYIAEGGPAPTLRTTGHPPGVAAVDCRNGTENAHVNGTLQAKSNGGMSMNLNYVVRNEYIVRRLTPTECARLQGFPDNYGVVLDKESLTDEEYEFWLKVRNTHAAINGKAVKDYTKQQMLTWYNKLHTDSAEYKMWGNGINLPCAEAVFMGIAHALGR